MGAPKKKPTTTLQYLIKQDSEADALSFEPYPVGDIVSMISECTRHVFTFPNPSESPEVLQQDLKRRNLAHILSLLGGATSKSSSLLDDDRVLSRLVSMLAADLFRPLPPPSGHPFLASACDALADCVEELTVTLPTPSWPHLQILYDILALVVSNASPKRLGSHLGHSFLANLLTLFQSEDPRERDRLRNVYHQIYSKVKAARPAMRRMMSNVLLSFAFDSSSSAAASERHSGIGDLLEIWGSIVDGLAVPLKEEHRALLARVLLPLHRHRGMHAYHRQLSYCVTRFVRKDPALGGVVVRRILGHWPVTNCHKEVLLIGELEDLLETIDIGAFNEVAVALCSRIAKCMTSCNSQVAERVLHVWNNEQFVRRIMDSTEDVLPAFVEAIEKNIKWHWCQSVQQLSKSVKEMLEEMDPQLYSKCLQELWHRECISGQREKNRREKWEILKKKL